MMKLNTKRSLHIKNMLRGTKQQQPPSMCKKLQFLKWPLEAGNKSESVPLDSDVREEEVQKSVLVSG